MLQGNRIVLAAFSFLWAILGKFRPADKRNALLSNGKRHHFVFKIYLFRLTFCATIIGIPPSTSF